MATVFLCTTSTRAGAENNFKQQDACKIVIRKFCATAPMLIENVCNAYRMKTWNKGMASVRSRSLVTSKIKKNKNHIIFRAGEPFYYCIKKNEKKVARVQIQPSNA